MKYVLPELDPQNRIIKFANVGNPDAWPKAASQYISIFGAIELVGLSLFPEGWNGSEQRAVNWARSPREMEKPAKFNSGGAAPGNSRIPERKIGRPLITQDLLPREFTHQQNAHVYAWHVERRQRQWEENKQASARLLAVVNWLAQRCRDGHLISYARLKSGGGLLPMADSEWNVDDPLVTFVCSGGHKRYFREFRSPGPFEVYLFFAKLDLQVILDRFALVPVNVAELNLARLSPTLQLAVRLALRKGYFSKATCETQPVREAEVRAAWPDELPDIPMTENSIKTIARMMGFPDRVAIERGKQGGRSKLGVKPKTN